MGSEVLQLAAILNLKTGNLKDCGRRFAVRFFFFRGWTTLCAMQSLAELQRRFGVSGVVKIDPGRGGLPRMAVNSGLAFAEIYLFGAHVTEFQPRGASPVLFVSQNSVV